MTGLHESVSEGVQSDGADSHRWEASFPSSLSWRTPVVTSTIAALLEDATARFSSRTFIEFAGSTISFMQFDDLRLTLAAAIRSWGLGAGDTVALYFPNSPFHVIGFFAAITAGCRVVCLSPLDVVRELAHKLESCGARTVLTLAHADMVANVRALADAGLIDRWVAGHDEFWASSGDWAPPAGEETLEAILARGSPGADALHWPAQDVDDVALVQFTGGTTGLPKGAMLTHRNLTAGVSMFNLRFNDGVDPEVPQSTYLVLPLFHIFAIAGVMLRCLQNGETIVMRPRFDAVEAAQDIVRLNVTRFFGVPTMYVALIGQIEEHGVDLSSLSYCVSGGAPLPVETEQKFHRLTGRSICVGWGMTESVGAGTMTDPRGSTRPGTIGLPLPGATIRIVDLERPGRECTPGETGEIQMQGPHIFVGYFGNDEETEAVIGRGWLETGDVGYMDEDGYVFLVDRKKDLIISSGYNVYPRVIEEAIYEHEAVEEVLVFGIPDDYRGEAAMAVIKLRSGCEPFSLNHLREFLATRIGRHELPAAVEFRPSLPRTAVGKLSRKMLVDDMAKEKGKVD